tara:strand:+ start:83 stop:625 length:543 start_codon:yes stop_codon:yes gene_type:complete
MKLRNIFFLTSLIIYLTNCTTKTSKNEALNKEEKVQPIKNLPVVDVKITLNDSVTNKGEEIIINIKITNNENKVQKLLFDKPQISTGGPWGTLGEVINLETKISVLKYQNKAILSSQVYVGEELNEHYINLQPGESIERDYILSEIVVFNSEDYILNSGKYEIQIFYHSSPSNTLTLKVI